MANDLTGMTFARAGQTVFSAFLQRLISVLIFSTDIQKKKAENGTSVTVPLIAAPGTALDLQNDHAGVRSASAEDISSSAVQVFFNQQPIKSFALTDEEILTIEEGLFPLVIMTKMQNTGYAVANAVLSYMFNLITAANYPNVAFTGLATNFDLDEVIDINAGLADAGWPVDVPGRQSMVMKPTYLAGLKKDKAIQNLDASGIPVAQTGQVRQVDIFPLHQSATLPPVGGTPAAQNLTGFVATAEAIAFAQRIVVPQHREKLMHFEVLEDPITKLTLCYRVWYDEDKGKAYYAFETLFGASKGKPTALQRIRSAA